MLRSIVPTAVATYLGTAGLQRKYRVTAVVLMVEIALVESHLPVECPAHVPPPDKEDPEISLREEHFAVHLNFLDWQLIRLALLLHCLPVSLKLGKAAYLGLLRIWSVLRQIGAGVCEEPLVAGSDGYIDVALRSEWTAEMAHERSLIEHSLTRLHLIQAELASLRLGHLESGDVD